MVSIYLKVINNLRVAHYFGVYMLGAWEVGLHLSLSHLTSKEEEKEKKNAAITKHTRLVDYEVLEYKSFVCKHMVFSWASSPGTLAKAPALMFPSLRATYKHMIALIREICATIELDLRT